MNLIRKIGIGVVLGVLLGLIAPKIAVIALFGSLFVGALKAIAPLLVLTLVAHALSQAPDGQKSNIRTILCLYLIGTFAAACVAVIASYLFPLKLVLTEAAATEISPPRGFQKYFKTCC